MIQFITEAELIPKGYEQLTSITSAASLTVPVGASLAIIQAETQDARFRDDGTDPTASVGMLLKAGENPLRIVTDLSKVRLINAVAGTIVNVQYYGQLA